MADPSPRGERKFGIQRLADPVAAPPPVAPPPPVTQEQEPETKPKKPKKERAPEPTGPTHCGARFRSASALLSYAGAVAGMRVTSDIDCRCSPDGEWWWATVPTGWDAVAQLAHAAGGETFLPSGGRWAMAPIGAIPDETTAVPRLDVSAWKTVGLDDLLAGTRLRPVRSQAFPAVSVVVPGLLARWIIGRAIELRLETSVTPVVRRPMIDEEPTHPALLIRLTAPPERTVPPAFAHALGNLPDVLTGRPTGLSADRLLVDIRSAAPIGATLLSHLIPENEVWALGLPDVGHVRLQVTGEPIDGATFFEVPGAADATATVMTDPGPIRPSPRPVQVVPVATDSAARVDAVLVDDEELKWLRDYLPSRPAGETAHLFPGPGRHLLSAPGGLAGEVPFGVPLSCVGPGGLFLELNYGFDPPLPPAARRKVFEVKEDPVAVTADGVFRFDRANLVPAWALWAGQPPATTAGLSPLVTGILGELSAAIREAEAARMREARPKEQSPPQVPVEDLIREAQLAQDRGDLVGAAGLMERAGRVLEAARLYERAAAQAQG